ANKIFLFLLLLSVCGCNLGETSLRDPAEVAEQIGLKLPASASGARAHAEGFQDWIYKLELELSRQDYEGLAKQVGITLSKDGEPPQFVGNWWTPIEKAIISWGSKETFGPNRRWSIMAFPATAEERCRVRIQVFDC